MHPNEPADVDEGHRALPPLAATHAWNQQGEEWMAHSRSTHPLPGIPASQYPSIPVSPGGMSSSVPPGRCRQVS